MVDVFQIGRLRIEVQAHVAIKRLILVYGIKDRLGLLIYGTNTDLQRQPLLNLEDCELYLFNIAFPVNLGPGTYSIQTSLASSETHLKNNYEWRDLAMVFNVININKSHFAGCAWIDPHIEILSL